MTRHKSTQSNPLNGPTIRKAEQRDFDSLLALDQLARQSVSRRDRILRGIDDGKIWTAVVDDQICGYALLSNGFFGHAFIELVVVHADRRRGGLGSLLIKHMESVCGAAKLFTSTNQSNAPMRAVLEKLGYQRSGIIHNLDPGDPELVYFKSLPHS